MKKQKPSLLSKEVAAKDHEVDYRLKNDKRRMVSDYVG